MKRSTGLVTIALILSSLAYAQEGPKAELTGFYSYFRFNPDNIGTLNSHSLNGGGAEFNFIFSRMVGIEAEFGWYQSNISNLFTYNLGPVVKFRSRKLEPFAEALFGGAHSGFYGSLCKQSGTCVTTNPSNDALDLVLGGGLDIPLSRFVAFRPVQVDYVLTRFANAFNGRDQNQSNFRYQAGIQLRF
jgi:hypothetical protein